MDGDLQATDARAAQALAAAAAAWQSDTELRACWHTYHLIGDTLRSQELASTARHDAAFLCAFRQRLANEPVIMAPLATDALGAAPQPGTLAGAGVQGGVRRGQWLMAPAAAAAGFLAVAGAMMVLRPAGTDDLAQVSGAASPQLVLAQTVPGTASAVVGVVPASSALMRDARIGAYLDAHRQAMNGGGSAFAGGVVRSVDTVVLDAK